jgi:methylphosphonate synthase
MRFEESEKSSRIMNRAGKPYYEYRDTAMSSVSLFRPEWIEELCVVEDNEAKNPKVQWNNGHFMHQFTYFIGDVNYYYKDGNGEKRVFVTKTGDSVYGTPLRPHTFTTRKGAKKNGLILALTYGNKISADTQQELSAIGTELSLQYHLDFSSRKKAFASLLKFNMEAATITIEELSKRTGLKNDMIKEYLEANSSIPDLIILSKISKALSISVRELIPPDEIEQKVIPKKYEQGHKWFYPNETKSYELIELVQSQNLPFSKTLEIIIHENSNDELDLKVGLHQYVYNIGESKIRFNWKIGDKKFQEEINPNDSIYIKPFVNHSFRGKGKLIVLRIGGRMAGDAQREFSNLSKEDARRAINETQMWFDPKGKQ